MDRKKYVSKLLETNNVGERLEFVRTVLELRPFQICQELGIPESSYSFYSAGRRTWIYEDLLRIAIFFNDKWLDRFESEFPEFKEKPVKEITITWLMFGEDKLSEKYEKRLKEMKDIYSTREIELIERNQGLVKRIRELEN